MKRPYIFMVESAIFNINIFDLMLIDFFFWQANSYFLFHSTGPYDKHLILWGCYDEGLFCFLFLNNQKTVNWMSGLISFCQFMPVSLSDHHSYRSLLGSHQYIGISFTSIVNAGSWSVLHYAACLFDDGVWDDRPKSNFILSTCYKIKMVIWIYAHRIYKMFIFSVGDLMTCF